MKQTMGMSIAVMALLGHASSIVRLNPLAPDHTIVLEKSPAPDYTIS